MRKKAIKPSMKNGGVYRILRPASVYYNNHRPKKKEFVLDRLEYARIVTDVNKYIAESLLEGKMIKFPVIGCKIYVAKGVDKPRIKKNGKVSFKPKIDWTETKRLWARDEEAKKDHILVRHPYPDDFVYYFVRYKKYHYRMKNGLYVDFKPTWTIVRKIYINAENGGILKDAPVEENIWKRLYLSRKLRRG